MNTLEMDFYKNFTISFLCLFFLNIGAAQIVNIEDKRVQLDSNTWQGQFDISSKFTQNTKSIFALSSALRIDKSAEKNNWIWLANYNFVKADKENFIDDGFVHLRYGKKLNPVWKWEFFGQLQYNQRLHINLRGLLGSGARLELLNKEKSKMAVGLLYMYEYNELDAEIATTRNYRLSSYLTTKLKHNDNFNVSATLYYQPLLKDFTQSRLSVISTLIMKINKFILFTSSFSLTRDNQLAKDIPDIPVSVFQWQNGLRFVF